MPTMAAALVQPILMGKPRQSLKEALKDAHGSKLSTLGA
jgi:hypothetical protein